MPERYDVAVLGVGGMGAAALAHLARRGLRAIGLEQDAVPSLRGSSVGETRVIRKAYYEDPRYVPLLERAYALWAELEARTGEPLFVRTGCMTLGPEGHEAIRGVLESVARHHLPHEVLGRAAVRARFPALSPSPGDVGVHEADAGYLHVERCTAAHAAWARDLGAELRPGAKVVALDLDGGVRARLADGTLVEADRGVVSAGAWLAASPAFAGIARGLPLVVERQVQLWFPRPAGYLPAWVHVTADRIFYAIATADSLKVCRHHGGATASPDTLDRELHPADEEPVREYRAAHLPSVTGDSLRARVCMYTNTPDQHFVVGRLPGRDHVVVLGGFSGHGYKMTPVMGEIAAQLAAGESPPFDLAIFDPARFADAAS